MFECTELIIFLLYSIVISTHDIIYYFCTSLFFICSLQICHELILVESQFRQYVTSMTDMMWGLHGGGGGGE
jgi:hypothetical protein